MKNVFQILLYKKIPTGSRIKKCIKFSSENRNSNKKIKNNKISKRYAIYKTFVQNCFTSTYFKYNSSIKLLCPRTEYQPKK